MADNPLSKLWNDGIKVISYCPLCDTRYNPMEAKILGEDSETHLFHVTCKECKHAVLSLVVVNHAGASSIGIVTDLSFDDVVRLHKSKEIGVNDVIGAYEYFSSDKWKSLIPEKKPQKRAVKAEVKKTN